MVSTKKEANLKKQASIRQEIENLIGIFQQAGSNAAFLEIQSRQKELQKLENQPMYQSDMPNITNYDVYINSPSNPLPVRGRPKKEVMDKPIEIIQPSKPRGRPPKPKAEEEYKEPKPRGRPPKNNIVNEIDLILDSINENIEKYSDTNQSKINMLEAVIRKEQDELDKVIKESKSKSTKEPKTKKPKVETYEKIFHRLQLLFKAPEFSPDLEERIMENINNREKLSVAQLKSVFRAAVDYYEKLRDEMQTMREDNEMALADGDEDAIEWNEYENILMDYEADQPMPTWSHMINYLGDTTMPPLKPKSSKPKKLKIGVKQIKETESKIQSQEEEIKRRKKEIKDFERELQKQSLKESKPKKTSTKFIDEETMFKSVNKNTKKEIENLKRKQNIKDTESKIKSQEERIRMMEDLVNSSKDFTPPKPRGRPKKTIQPSDFFLTPRIERNMPKKELSELTTLYNSTSNFKPSEIVKKNEMSKKDMKTMMDLLDTPRVARAIPKKDMNELMSLLDAPKVSKTETKANMKSMIDLLDTPRVARMMPRKELNEMMSLLTTTKDFKPSEIIKKTKKSKKTKKEIKSMMSMLDTPRISRTAPSRDFQLFNDFLTPPRSTVNPVGRGVFTLDGLNQAFEGVDWTANRLKSSLKGYVMGRGDAYPPYVKTIIEKYGDQEIVGLTLSRNPLDSAIINFLNVLSLGKLNKRLERAGYDKMFHLRLNVKLQNGKTISIEKNPLINMEVSPKNLPKAEFKEVYNIPQGITLFNLLEAAQSKMGSKYFTYSTSTNNCQNYVMNLLSASNIGDTEDIAFLKQDVEQLFQKYGYLKNLTDKITDTAARANEIYYGAGFCC
jgi:hypothetical protein